MRWYSIPDIENYKINKAGKVLSLKRNIILKDRIKPNGYNTAMLSGKSYYIHRLVAITFIEGINKQVNHIDGNKLNNRVKNLEWCDAFHNQRHRRDVLNKPYARGEQKVKSCKLNDMKVRQIKKLINKNISLTIVANKYNVSIGTISAIKTGRTWKHL